ncbi:MAG: hypothetical protein QM758_11810 [Armatimonas sp.]
MKGPLIRDVWTICVDGTNLHQLTQGKFYNVSGPTFSSGMAKRFSLPPGFELVTWETAGRPSTKLLRRTAHLPQELFGSLPGDEGGSAVGDIALSPDGKQFVCISDYKQPYCYDITLMSREGKIGERLGLGKQSGDVEQPRFSADGKSIYYLRDTMLWCADLMARTPLGYESSFAVKNRYVLIPRKR